MAVASFLLLSRTRSYFFGLSWVFWMGRNLDGVAVRELYLRMCIACDDGMGEGGGARAAGEYEVLWYGMIG